MRYVGDDLIFSSLVSNCHNIHRHTKMFFKLLISDSIGEKKSQFIINLFNTLLDSPVLLSRHLCVIF